MPKNKSKIKNNQSNIRKRVKTSWLVTSVNPNHDITWKKLPVLPIVFQYLNLTDSISASSVCKSFRQHLEPTIFRKIRLLPKDYLKKPTPSGKKFARRAKQKFYCTEVIETLWDKRHLVKAVDITEDFNDEFACRFFSTFCHITDLNIVKAFLPITVLYEMLEPLLELKHLTLQSGDIYHHRKFAIWITDWILPPTIQSVNVQCDMPGSINVDPFERLDETNVNLQSVTLINYSMLKTFTTQFPSLKELEILNFWPMEDDLHQLIIQNNPQIERLIFPFDQLNESIMNAILSLKQLNYFKLNGNDHYQDPEDVEWQLVDNESIKEFELEADISETLLTNMINRFRSLNTIISNSPFGYQLEFLPWNLYVGNLHIIQLLFNGFIGADWDLYEKCASLKQIILVKPEEEEWLGGFEEFMREKVHWSVEIGDRIVVTKLTPSIDI